MLSVSGKTKLREFENQGDLKVEILKREEVIYVQDGQYFMLKAKKIVPGNFPYVVKELTRRGFEEHKIFSPRKTTLLGTTTVLL